jgi:hypothetical protein
MSIHWDALLGVFVVSLGAAVAVVALVAVALLGFSARVPVADATAGPRPSRGLGTAVAAACLAAAALVALFGLWVIITR